MFQCDASVGEIEPDKVLEKVFAVSLMAMIAECTTERLRAAQRAGKHDRKEPPVSVAETFSFLRWILLSSTCVCRDGKNRR